MGEQEENKGFGVPQLEGHSETAAASVTVSSTTTSSFDATKASTWLEIDGMRYSIGEVVYSTAVGLKRTEAIQAF